MLTVDILGCGRLAPPLTAQQELLRGRYRRRRTQEQMSLFRRSQQCSSAFMSYQGHAAYAVAVLLPRARNLRTVRAFGLHFQDLLLTQIYQQLPFAWHI